MRTTGFFAATIFRACLAALAVNPHFCRNPKRIVAAMKKRPKRSGMGDMSDMAGMAAPVGLASAQDRRV
jgi:hypothetical protein